MNAYQIEDTSHTPGLQVKVPPPARDESSTSNMNFLLDGLRAAGKGKAFDRVQLHARGEYRTYLCLDGHVTPTPDSCLHRLCPRCRQRRILTWGESLLDAVGAAEKGYVFEALCELNPKHIGDALSKAVRSQGAAAFFDIRPTPDDKWRVVAVVVGHDSSGVEVIEDAIRKATGGKMVSRRIFNINDLGKTLDESAVRLTDFRGSINKLHEYLMASFGHQIKRKRERRSGVQSNDGIDRSVCSEPEEAAAQFQARLSESQFAIDYPESVKTVANGESGGGRSETLLSDMEVTPLHSGIANQEGGSIIMSNAGGNTSSGGNGKPLKVKGGPSAAPEAGKTTHVSFAPSDSIRPGPQCSVCGKATIFIGTYKPRNGRMEKVGTDGNGPPEIEGRKIFEPTGELRARLRDE